MSKTDQNRALYNAAIEASRWMFECDNARAWAQSWKREAKHLKRVLDDARSGLYEWKEKHDVEDPGLMLADLTAWNSYQLRPENRLMTREVEALCDDLLMRGWTRVPAHYCSTDQNMPNRQQKNDLSRVAVLKSVVVKQQETIAAYRKAVQTKIGLLSGLNTDDYATALSLIRCKQLRAILQDFDEIDEDETE